MFKSRHMGSRPPKLEIFGDYLFFAYANLQMLMMAIKTGRRKFDKPCFIVRAKAYGALRSGKAHIHDLYQNNVWKLKDNSCCWYCGKEMPKNKLTVDHVFPRSKGGSDDFDNIVLACKECNSSKNDLDLLEWYSKRLQYWPLPYIFAYYLKHVYLYAQKHDLLDKTSEEIDAMDVPFKYEYIPLKYPDEYLDSLQEIYSQSGDPAAPIA